MVEIREMLAPAGTACRSGYQRTGFIGVTIHETANTSPGAGALNHAKYLQNSGKENSVSWHYAVDDALITRSVPEKERAWHAGDGRNGNGNCKTIAIEICVNPESDYDTAVRNAAELAADVLVRNGIDNAWAGLFTHSDWMKKSCPYNILKDSAWEKFNNTVQHFIDKKKPKPIAHKEYEIYAAIPGYYTAADALKGTDKRVALDPGMYYVYKEVEGSINVTKTPGEPGAWIDACKNAMENLEKISIGDTVRLNGYVFADSYGEGKSKQSYRQTGEITKVTDLERPFPYHFADLGWVDPDSVELLSSGGDTAFKVGDKVVIRQSAKTYSRSTVTIPAKYKGKAYTVQQVGDDDVLLQELYSWVKKTDVTEG